MAAPATSPLEAELPPERSGPSRAAKPGSADAFAKALERARRTGKPGRDEADPEAQAAPRSGAPTANAAAIAASAGAIAMPAGSPISTATPQATPTPTATPTRIPGSARTACSSSTATPTATSSASPTAGEGPSRASDPPRPAPREAPGSEATRANGKAESAAAAPGRPTAFRLPSTVQPQQPRKPSQRDAPPPSPLGDVVARAGRERIAREPERTAPRAEAKLRAPEASGQLGPPHAPSPPAAQAGGPDAPRSAAPASALSPALAADPRGDVTGAILPSAAHLRISSDVLGEVTLHLRLRDGAAHLRVEASAPSPLQARAPELARALASEGIALAKLDVEPRPPAPVPAAPREGGIRPDAGGGGRNARDERQAQDDLPGSRPTAPARSRPRRRSGHHVTA